MDSENSNVSAYARARRAYRIAAKWVKITRRVGPSRAAVEYVRERLAADPPWAPAIVELASRADESRHAADALHGPLGVLDATAAAHGDAIARLTGEVERLERALDRADERTELLRRILETTRWSASARLADPPLVSVVLPTRNRPSLVANAIASVKAQTYAHWELLVVDDAGPAHARVDASALDDPRIRLFETGGVGVCRARNRALREARGSLVAYLDDDNWMFPEWLKAVAWCMSVHPEVDFLFGARVMQRPNEWFADAHAPTLQFEPFDRERLLGANYIDMGVMAHRAGLPEARFDESLDACVDWDLMLRLTREKPGYALPVIASAYTMDAPARITARDSPEIMPDLVRAKHAAPVEPADGPGSQGRAAPET